LIQEGKLFPLPFTFLIVGTSGATHIFLGRKAVKLTVLHLSDIHFKYTYNPVTERIEQIAAALHAQAPDAAACLVAVTGDIAHSGKASEYAIAQEFFTKLVEAISKNQDSSPCLVVFVPGNHDCDFDKDSQARQTIASSIAQDIRNIQSNDTSIPDLCLQVQEEFFLFVKAADPLAEIDSPSQKLHYTRKLVVADKIIKCECYNTSWLSSLREKQGQLLYPEGFLTEGEEKYDLVLSLFHHPYNWLEANNARAFRKHIERTSDIVLTGHEHQPELYEKRHSTGETAKFTEGAVLQDTDTDGSGFNVLQVDLETESWKATQYEWVSEERMYQVVLDTKWLPLGRKTRLRRHEFEISEEFANTLADPGAPFTHPRAEDLRLNDLFVYPDLHDCSIGKGTRELIFGERVARYATTNHHVLFTGAERIGKTTLARVLFQALRDHGVVPVLINGNVIRKSTQDQIVKILEASFGEQYSKDLWAKYLQLPKGSKAIIVDDLHRMRLTKGGRTELLTYLCQISEYVLLFADSVFDTKGL